MNGRKIDRSKMASKKPRMAIHIDAELKRQFEYLAWKKDRAAANLGLHLIKQYVEEAQTAGELDDMPKNWDKKDQ